MNEKASDKIGDILFIMGYILGFAIGILIMIVIYPYYSFYGEKKAEELLDRVFLIGRW